MRNYTNGAFFQCLSGFEVRYLSQSNLNRPGSIHDLHGMNVYRIMKGWYTPRDTGMVD